MKSLVVQNNKNLTEWKYTGCGTCPIFRQGSSMDFEGKEFRINMWWLQQILHLWDGTTLRARIRVHKQQIKEPDYRKIKLSDHLDIIFTMSRLYITESSVITKPWHCKDALTYADTDILKYVLQTVVQKQKKRRKCFIQTLKILL